MNETIIEILENQIKEVEKALKKVRIQIKELKEMEITLELEEIKLIKAIEEIREKKDTELDKAKQRLQEIKDEEIPNSP